LTDNVGSVRQLVRTDGTVRDAITYSAFGTPTDTHANQGDRFKFTGREYDAGAGQYYYRARYYGADVGRFRSEDPIGFAGSEFNLSRYARNNPTSDVDPTGLAPRASWIIRAEIERVTNLINDLAAGLVTRLPGIPGIIPAALVRQLQELRAEEALLNSMFERARKEIISRAKTCGFDPTLALGVLALLQLKLLQDIWDRRSVIIASIARINPAAAGAILGLFSELDGLYRELADANRRETVA
jgi:RHS repeat-associated protein